MKKIQTQILKIIALLPVVLAVCNPTFAVDATSQLKKADSLFTAKLYTQSFDVYNDLLANKSYSPSMLLKMAFIQEGLGHVGLSLYYLNMYASLTNDAQAGEKIKELAAKNNLEGYNDPYSKEQITRILREQKLPITGALVAVTILLASIMAYQKSKNKKPMVTGLVLTLFLSLLFWQINFSEAHPAGIIAASNTYIMEGPSAGSSVVAVAAEGHKLAIEGRYDIWLKVRWNGKDAFVNNHAVLPLTLN